MTFKDDLREVLEEFDIRKEPEIEPTITQITKLVERLIGCNDNNPYQCPCNRYNQAKDEIRENI